MADIGTEREKVKKDIKTLLDLEREDFEVLFVRALDLKQRYKRGILDRSLTGRTLGMIFEKASTRTRVSFEAAIIQLGGTPVFMSTSDLQIARNEPIKDTARVLSRFLDCIAIRTYSQDHVEEFARYSSIPIINALTDLYHPCQILSDLLTIIEFHGGYKEKKIVWVGDGNNVANSWINAASILGLNLFLACPESYSPNPDVIKNAKATGVGTITLMTDPIAAVKDADIIYTDVWASMGQEDEVALRKKILGPYQVNQKLLKEASKDAIVMHCLPAHKGEEITEEVLEGPQSVVWDQSENKLHMHKAILETLILKKNIKGE